MSTSINIIENPQVPGRVWYYKRIPPTRSDLEDGVIEATGQVSPKRGGGTDNLFLDPVVLPSLLDKTQGSTVVIGKNPRTGNRLISGSVAILDQVEILLQDAGFMPEQETKRPSK